MDVQTILENVKELSCQFAKERSERQKRRELDQHDFDRLKEAGYLLVAVPEEQGGIWENIHRSTRPICEILRTLAHGDSSVSLVSSMHPAVIGSFGWLTVTEAPPPFQEAWEEQRRWVFQTACDGHWWGTIVSEPGSGGDASKSNTVARLGGQSDSEYLISGRKHFGSGSGITSFMITTAVPEGEDEPDGFFMDMQDVPWDGSTGVKLMAAWDGHGMTATQSHAMEFKDFPATRVAWPCSRDERLEAGAGSVACMFTSVAVGVVETAIETARKQLERNRDSMRSYEEVEWVNIEQEGWLIQQAYEGMLRAVEEDKNRVYNIRLGKTAIATLAESVMLRICKVIGGGAYSRHTPYGFWLEDVRALGYLRPPWGLAYDTIFEGSWEKRE